MSDPPNSSAFRPPPSALEDDTLFMSRALELAARGEGYVEPNPMVGCVMVRDGAVVGEGWHRKFGGPHAEGEALRVAGRSAQGATAFVTLEPCCHHGKTPPCTDALIAAGVRRVVCAQRDPFAEVSGRGIAVLETAGIAVEVGLLAEQARQLNAPYLKLVATGRPWVVAKWAMSLDGKIATRTGDSRWISGAASREIVHQLRGCVDGIIVGHGTVSQDDPLLTARPPGPRIATRIVVDSLAAISSDRQLVQTAHETPVLIAAGADAPRENIDRLTAAGCEVVVCRSAHAPPHPDPLSPRAREKRHAAAHVGRQIVDETHQRSSIGALLDELGRRRMTNVLVEGGGALLGSFFDAGAIDEVHVFIAAKILGGHGAAAPVMGHGIEKIASALSLDDVESRYVGTDFYVHGRVARR
jgi:diaminohydroxyphosphoribosylaminopyrimidine deaminase / 5-amino-6-(5-phosphoribosylamino)uracil reductase